jgi:flagellar motor switch protein FliN/FliY
MSDDSQDENEKLPENEDTPENESAAEGESENPNDIDIDSLVDDVAAGVDDASDASVTDDWAAAMAEDPTTVEAGRVDDEWGDAMAEEANSVKQAPLDALTDEGGSANNDLSPELDVILDIPVSISMEVGRTEIPIRNLLQLNQGSVVELDRLAGEPLDVLVNGTLIAHGEVVMVNDKFGIRLTDVVSQSERIQRLR